MYVLAIVLSVPRRFTVPDYFFDIFNYFWDWLQGYSKNLMTLRPYCYNPYIIISFFTLHDKSFENKHIIIMP
jgi:hypothetical protein